MSCGYLKNELYLKVEIKGGGMEANSKEPVWNMQSMKVCDL